MCVSAKMKFSTIALTHSLHLICMVLHPTVLLAKLFIQLYICKKKCALHVSEYLHYDKVYPKLRFISADTWTGK